VSVRYGVLGPVEITAAGRPVVLPAQPLTLLAGLLVRANTVVSVDALVEALWPGGDDAPANPRGTVQTYVTRLRRALGPDAVQTSAAGYRIDLGPDELDLLRFQALAEQGDAAAAAGDDATATARFDEALAQWRGPALQDVRSEVLHRDVVPALDEQRLDVWERWVDGQLRQGELPIEQLHRLTRENPLRERFWEQLMIALYRAGRQADALAAYRQIATVLADELGLDPGPALQQLQRSVLAGDRDLQSVPRRTEATPRQLSAVADGFTGRVDELRRLAKVLDEDVATVVIDGAGGVGKTALALRFAHEVADRFADGQVQLNLHGYGPGDPVEPGEALATLLQSVGVPSEQVPATTEARSALWRTHSADRTMLVLLDNARDSEQVRPLLPGSGGLVVVTSRSQLGGLVARDGAARVSVARLPEADAVALLAAVIGAERVQADPGAARRFVEVCARLPLAIRILGQHANEQPDRPLAELVDEISSDPLAAFDLDDGAETNLRDIFARSYAALDDDTARLFRRLGAHPGPTFGVGVAAALAGVAAAPARRLLGRLVSANLLEQPRPGRYEFHDLLREFAVEQAGPDDAPALERMLDWYLQAALRACETIRPRWAERAPESADLQLPTISTLPDAVDWYAAEHDNLLAAFHAARAGGHHRHTYRLVLAMRPHFNRGTPFELWVATHEPALDAARLVGDRRAEGRLLGGLGTACVASGQYRTALRYSQQALAIGEELDASDDRFSALTNLGNAYRRLGDLDAALEFSTRALAVAQGLGEPRQTAVAHNNLADRHLHAGRPAEALRHARLAEQLARQAASTHDQAVATMNIAQAEEDLQHLEVSLARLDAALDLVRQTANQKLEADVLEKAGDLYVELHSPGPARRRYRQAVDLLAGLGHRDADRVRGKLAGLG
jgi:DNA-binding SARP family transcriptional activator/predicted negative regulator of RcsB-dependent stress response